MLHLPTPHTPLYARNGANKLRITVLGGGNAGDLISSDYSELYGLLRALYASVCSRLFRVYTFTN